MKLKLLLIPLFILTLWIAYEGLLRGDQLIFKAAMDNIGQPFSLTVDHASPQLQAACRASDNCMDLVEAGQSDCDTDTDCCNKHPNLCN